MAQVVHLVQTVLVAPVVQMAQAVHLVLQEQVARLAQVAMKVTLQLGNILQVIIPVKIQQKDILD
jgi:hypothetical protein